MDCGLRKRVQQRNILGSCFEDQEGGILFCGRYGADGVSTVLQLHVHVPVCYCLREKGKGQPTQILTLKSWL